jgi:hypothetical protein
MGKMEVNLPDTGVGGWRDALPHAVVANQLSWLVGLTRDGMMT